MSRRYFLVALFALSLTGCISVNLAPGQRRGELKEEVIEPATGWFTRSKIALITLSGEITGDGQPGIFGSEDSTVLWMKDQLKQAEQDNDVKAVVLRIDSPGGEVSASDEIYREMKLFKQKRHIPVLVSIVDVGASGGYYVALAGDKIYAEPTAITGSIGVISKVPEIDGLGQKLGIGMRTIKSGTYKDLGSIWRVFTPGEQQILQQMIDQLYDRFVGIVAENRPKLKDPAAVRVLADGRVYTAQQASANGLIDGVKYLDEVIDLAKQQANLHDANIIGYKHPGAYRGNIYAQDGGSAPNASAAGLNLAAALQSLSQPRIEYKWEP